VLYFTAEITEEPSEKTSAILVCAQFTGWVREGRVQQIGEEIFSLFILSNYCSVPRPLNE
jgi:hypothetical protein